jgi:hypothetical protein
LVITAIPVLFSLQRGKPAFTGDREAIDEARKAWFLPRILFVAAKRKVVLTNKGSNRVDGHHKNALMPAINAPSLEKRYIFQSDTRFSLF